LQNDDNRRLPEWNHMVAAELPPRKDWSMGASVATMPRATAATGERSSVALCDGRERVPIKWTPLIDKDAAQNRGVGACQNRKSQATSSGHALEPQDMRAELLARP